MISTETYNKDRIELIKRYKNDPVRLHFLELKFKVLAFATPAIIINTNGQREYTYDSNTMKAIAIVDEQMRLYDNHTYAALLIHT